MIMMMVVRDVRQQFPLTKLCPLFLPSTFTTCYFLQADDMGMTVKEMITMTEGLTRNEVGCPLRYAKSYFLKRP